MSRKPLPEGLSGPAKGDSLNSLIAQLEDPRSLVSFLPLDSQAAFLSIPEDYLNIDEVVLLEQLKTELNWEPSMMAETLRLNFWLEYDRVSFSKSENQMNMTNIYLGVCSRTHWMQINSQPHVLAFILSRPIGYKASYESLQQLSNRKFHQILSLPIKEHGKVNIKLLELQAKVAAMVDLRNQGGYIARSETKNLNLIKQETKHTYSQALNTKVTEQTAGAIEADIAEKLKELEDEARTHLPPPQPKFERTEVVDAEYTDVTKHDDGK